MKKTKTRLSSIRMVDLLSGCAPIQERPQLAAEPSPQDTHPETDS